MKTCSNPNCAQINPQELTSFQKRKDSKDGLRYECKACTKKRNDFWVSANREKKKAIDRAWAKANIEKRRAKNAVWAQKNPKKVSISRTIWQKSNRGKVNALWAKRHAAKLQATPSWLNELQIPEIESFYVEAARLTKETGIAHHVDHIVPLQGKEVRGLHVPWNLQILTAEENHKKGNKIIN